VGGEFEVIGADERSDKFATPGNEHGRTRFHMPDAFGECGFCLSHGYALVHGQPPFMTIMTVLTKTSSLEFQSGLREFFSQTP